MSGKQEQQKPIDHDDQFDEDEDVEDAFVDDQLAEGEQEFILEEGDQLMDVDEFEKMLEQQGEGDEPSQENDQPAQDDSVQFYSHNEPVYSVAIHPKLPDVCASGGGDDMAVIWNMKDGKKLHELTGHKDSVSCVRFNMDGKLLATASYDGTVKIWETWSGKLSTTLEGPAEGVDWLVWHDRGNVVLAGSPDGSVWMWNAQTGVCMNVFAGHAGAVMSGLFSLDGKQIVTAGEDTTVRVWDPKTATTSHVFKGGNFHSQPVLTLQNHPTQVGSVLTGSEDGSAKLINITNGKVMSTYAGHNDSVESVGFCLVPSLPFISTASLDHTIKIWDMTTAQLRTTLQHDDGVVRTIWHPTHPVLFSASTDSTIRMWDVRTGKADKVWRGHRAPILDLCLSPDGNTLLSGSDDQSALVWKVVN